MAEIDYDEEYDEYDENPVEYLYDSLSNIIDQIKADHLLLLKQAEQIRREMGILYEKINQIDTKRITKMIVDTRSMLLKRIDLEVSKTNDDTIINDIKNEIRSHVKKIIDEEIKLYTNKLPTLDKKFNALVREQRASLSQYMRRSHYVDEYTISNIIQRLEKIEAKLNE